MWFYKLIDVIPMSKQLWASFLKRFVHYVQTYVAMIGLKYEKYIPWTWFHVISWGK